ncbi:MAG TPA: DUF2851 family protein [Dehalococcoidia bacterium]|nr:DUF2851 family protein [Dehalococcoidia bacterium]
MTHVPTYQRGPFTCLRLGEPPPEPLNESELAWIWAGQRFPPEALQAVDGRELRVLNPGRRGGSAGPDFRDAVFVLDGQQRHGDVELHVRASAFRSHGHDTDPAYDSVALHVVFRADGGAVTALSNGGNAPVAEFAPWLEGRTQELQRWLVANPLWREPCVDARARLGDETLSAELRAAGLRRFEAKTGALRRAVAEHGPEQALWLALFDRLSRSLPIRLTASMARDLVEVGSAGDDVRRTFRREAGARTLEAALLYAGGLSASAPRGLEAVEPVSPPLPVAGRPANHPRRRIAGVARLFVRARGDLAGYAEASVADAEGVKALVAAWQVADPAGGTALIGPARARELALNLALPYAALSSSLREKAIALLEALPAASPYGKTGFLENTLRRPDGKRGIAGTLEQQGLLDYLGRWCSQGGCGRCPLSPGQQAEQGA